MKLKLEINVPLSVSRAWYRLSERRRRDAKERLSWMVETYTKFRTREN